MPAWFDPKDPFKGRALKEQQTRETERQVRTPLAFLNNQQNVAQAVPETHDPKWKPDEKANPEEIGTDPNQKRFANSIRSVTKKYVRDAHHQEVLESWVADAHHFPMGVLKVHFERNLEGEPLKQGVEQDGQDNLARIKQLSEDIARGHITKDDARAVELADLLAGMGQAGEIEVREGLVIENLDLRRVRFPYVAALEHLYSAPWISHEEDQAKKRLRALYPYKVTKTDQGGNPVEWTGIHPEDLDSATPCANGAARKRHLSEMRDRSASGMSSKRDTSEREKDDNTKLLVREVWDRESGYVLVFVEGVPYPAAKWKPTKTPAQWYPFIFLVLNRVFGQVTGIADSELQADTQARIHRKQTDEEVARWKSMPRGFIDSTMMDETEQKAAVQSEPFCFKPLKLGGKGIEMMIKTFQWVFNKEWFNRSDDHVDLQRTAALPQQATGVTGGPNAPSFAKEVEVAAAGNAVSSNFRNNRIRRTLERFYDVCAQILLWEVDQDAALAVDDTVFWPTIYSDREARAAYQQIEREVRAQVVHEVIAQIAPRDPITGVPNPQMINPQEIKRITAEQSQPIIEQRCIQQFGMPRPMSRESMYRQLRIHVSVVQDAELDRQKRLVAFTKGLETTALAIRAAAEAGISADWRPMLKQVSRLSGGDEDMAEEMFSVDANGATAMLAQALQQGAQLSPEAIATLQQLVPAIVQQAQQAQAQETQPTAGGEPAPTAQPAQPAGAAA